MGRSEQGNPILEWDRQEYPTTSAGIEIPIPEHFQVIKKSEPQLALDWRLKIRTIFQTLFHEGYALVGVNRTTLGVHYYRVVKRNTIPLNTRKRRKRMIIKEITIRKMKMMMKHPFTTSFGTLQEKDFLLLEAKDELGNSGWGESVAFQCALV